MTKANSSGVQKKGKAEETTKPDWMIDEPLPPLKDTRTKAQKRRDEKELKKHRTVYIPLKFPVGCTGNICIPESDLD